MNCDQACGSQAMTAENKKEFIEQKITTVADVLDVQINAARKRVEHLCIVKAKAEASGLLDFPYQAIQELVYL